MNEIRHPKTVKAEPARAARRKRSLFGAKCTALAAALAAVLIAATIIAAQSGVLIPLPADKPDPAILRLAVMNVEVSIDNQHAAVKIVQIFENRAEQSLEGKYVFALPEKSLISDFAVWDGDQRIPGVMMEKRRANEVYEAIKREPIDPGILQTTDETASASGFSAKITPINPYATKRLEMEYEQELPIENLHSRFAFPLKPGDGETQTVGEFNLKIRVVNSSRFAVSTPENSAYPLHITSSEPNSFAGEFHAANVTLDQDFALDYRFDQPADALSVIAYRAPERITAFDLRDPRLADRAAHGYFQANALFAPRDRTEAQPRRVVVLLDTSLSMHGDKIARAVEAVEYFLRGLTAEDEFSLILFADRADAFAPNPLPAVAANVELALDFIKNSSLGGGTNLKLGLQKASAERRKMIGGAADIVLISDANPTLEEARAGEIERVLDDCDCRLFAFAPGADADAGLLKILTEKTHGYYETARETEDIALRLRLFFEKIGAPDIARFALSSPDDANLYDVYADRGNSFFGSNVSFVGRYRQPQTQTIDLTARFGDAPINLSSAADLPAYDETHDFLPRVWARARVDALTAQMNRDGERADYIAEIIALSEKYKFVTDYTAFIAAPRALLRPRLIQPGDPVIRVKTDASVIGVFAVLPFGETLPLKFLPAEGVWETRFLAPVWMVDGAYKCRLLLTDKDGGGTQETKTFIVDSRAPKVKINLERLKFRAGEEINLKVSADADTARLNAKFYGAPPAPLAWDEKAQANVGILKIPGAIIPGKYVLSVAAEDFAHNQASDQVTIEVTDK